MRKNPNLGKALKKANYIRWRKQRGIKIIVCIKPYGQGGFQSAVCTFEGKKYEGLGKTNIVALNAVFSLLKRGANLDGK